MDEKKRKTIEVHIELKGFEEVENKVKQLLELLREANNLAASLEKERC